MKFKVGDKVAVYSTKMPELFRDTPLKISEIDKVFKQYLKLKDGSLWTLNGTQRGNPYIIHEHIEHATIENIIKYNKFQTFIKSKRLFEKMKSEIKFINIDELKEFNKIMENTLSTIKIKKEKNNGLP